MNKKVVVSLNNRISSIGHAQLQKAKVSITFLLLLLQHFAYCLLYSQLSCLSHLIL